MLIDVTLKMTSQMMIAVFKNAANSLPWQMGTHFDTTSNEFPLEYLERRGVVFDVSNVEGREILVSDIDISLLEEGMFVALCSNYCDTVGYGTYEYFNKCPKLSFDLMYELLKKKICIVGLDFGRSHQGILKKVLKHFSKEREPFIIENLCNLKLILNGKKAAYFKASTFPMHFEGFSGNPCRVVARIEKKF